MALAQDHEINRYPISIPPPSKKVQIGLKPYLGFILGWGGIEGILEAYDRRGRRRRRRRKPEPLRPPTVARAKTATSSEPALPSDSVAFQSLLAWRRS